MLRHALRRLLWFVPTLVGIMLATFALLSYVPDPAADPRLADVLGKEQLDELRRSRFLDLPRLFNANPRDLRARVDAIVAHVVAGDRAADDARAELVRLGGAALPYLLPRLDGLDPQSRARVAVALAPIADRMGIVSDETRDPERAVAFWSRFWADREIDFRPASARRAARRLALHRTSMREADLYELDTFALDELFRIVSRAARGGDRELLARMLAIVSHVTGRVDPIADGASRDEARACAERWEEWWLVHRADYVAYDGPTRLAAMIADTQYARWTERMIRFRLGVGSDGVPVLDKLRARAPRTLAIAGLAILFAYLAAIPLGIASAARQRRSGDLALLALAVLAHAVPTACVAALVATARRPGDCLLVPALVLALALVASPARQQRSSLLDVIRLDWIRAARARGLGPLRIVLAHALPNTIAPTVTLLSLELPMALTGAFVVEQAFGVPGLGEETIRAVQTHDVAWLMAIALGAATAGALSLLVGDLALAAVDPRLRTGFLRRARTAE